MPDILFFSEITDDLLYHGDLNAARLPIPPHPRAGGARTIAHYDPATFLCPSRHRLGD